VATAKKKPEPESPAHPTALPGEKVDGKDTTSFDRGLEDLSVEQLDGAYAVFRLGKETRIVGQSDLVRAQKKLTKGVQGTY